MALARTDIDFIKAHLGEWLAEAGLGRPMADLELRERMVRVEEEFKAQRALMQQGFDQVERHLQQQDLRFETADQRFESLLERQDRHFRWLIGFMLSCAGLVVAAQRWL